MATWATFNARADGIACWTCEHFQRYDDGSFNPSICEGECRKDPPQFMAADTLYSCDPPPAVERLREGFFTFIPFGNTSWCSGYQRSLETNIPAPQPSYWHCPHQTTLTFENPYTRRSVPGPYSKKPVTESCWYCSHFQRFNEAETMENWACHGYCQIKPPQAWTREVPQWGSPVECYTQSFIFPRVQFAPRVWCSRWERNPDAAQLPAPPQQNGVLCGAAG